MTNEVSKIKDKVVFLASDDNPFHKLESAKRSIKAFNPEVITSEIVKDAGLLQIDAPNLLQHQIEQFLDKITRKN